MQITLDDVHVRDERGSRQYRTYRGERLPVYKPPLGIGLLQKERGERKWSAWINVLPRFVTNLLTLLGSGRDLYIALDERRQDRLRRVQGFSLQTTDPAKE